MAEADMALGPQADIVGPAVGDCAGHALQYLAVSTLGAENAGYPAHANVIADTPMKWRSCAELIGKGGVLVRPCAIV